MGLLSTLFREAHKKDAKMQEAVFDVSYPTGFLGADFLNGSIVYVNDGSYYYSVGVVDGSSTTLIGRSGCGKTTLALQYASNIVRNFENSVIFYDDIEGGSNGSRRAELTKFSPEEIDDKIIYRNSGITAENFFQRISSIHDLKLANREKFEYDTGLVDPKGRPIFKLEPTVYILDSIAMLVPDKLSEEEELSGQMSATAMAKTNTQVFKRIIPKLKAANIILFAINHINDKVELNPFAKTAAQVSYLDPGETLPGGRAAIYLANNMFKLKDSTKLKDSEGLGIHGKIIDVSIIKSRTNAGGKSVPLIFDSVSGFDQELSLLILLKSTGHITAKGAYMTMEKYPDIKFTQKGFKEKLHTDEVFKNAFEDTCKDVLVTLIPKKETDMAENNTNIFNDVTSSILNSL